MSKKLKVGVLSDGGGQKTILRLTGELFSVAKRIALASLAREEARCRIHE